MFFDIDSAPLRFDVEVDKLADSGRSRLTHSAPVLDIGLDFEAYRCDGSPAILKMEAPQYLNRECGSYFCLRPHRRIGFSLCKDSSSRRDDCLTARLSQINRESRPDGIRARALPALKES
jgi:hypothetical protein